MQDTVFSVSQILLRVGPFVRALLLVAICIVMQADLAVANPHIQWRKIETEHFEILYDSRHYQLAKDVARSAESAWMTLAPVLRTWPDKTVIVIDDRGDQANGMATGFPFPQMHLYPAVPAPGDSISDTGPWGLELITHEYTHVLNFQPAHGVFSFARSIFGSIVRPNLLLPRWYLEGLAVETETRYSPSGGRLRSPNFTAIPRAMIQDNTLRREDIARIGDIFDPEWPGGIRPYLFGGLVWNYLSRKNISLIGDLNDHFARRIPFLIDTPIQEREQKTWQEILDTVYAELESKAVHQIDVICEGGAAGCNDGSKVGEPGFYSRSPVLSKSQNTLAFLTREHNHDSALIIANRNPDRSFDVKNAVRAAEPDGTNRITWLPDETAVIYDAIDSFGRYEERSDLWVYDRERKRNKRITNGWRAREPGISPDGKYIAFVQLTPGNSSLAIAKIQRDEKTGDFTASPATVIYKPSDYNRVSWPEFIANDTIVFSERGQDGREVLKVVGINLKMPAVAPLANPRILKSGGDASFPRLVSDSLGRRHLLFASARNGVTNLYLGRLGDGSSEVNSLEAVVPVTNSSTRAWIGDLDSKNDALIFSRLDGNGSHLRILRKEDRELMPAINRGQLTNIEPLVEPPAEPYSPPDAGLSDSRLQLATHEFSVWPYMIPRYWMPYAAFVPGGAYLSASTSAGDPLGLHTVAASVSTDTRHSKPNIFGAYINATTDVRYTFLVDDFWQRLSSSGFDRRTTTSDLSGMFYIPSLSNSWHAEIGLNHQRSEIPTTTATDIRIRGGVRAGLLWQSLTQRGHEISAEKGGVFKFSHARFLPELGNQVYDKSDLVLGTQISKVSHPKWMGWLPERHVLALAANVSWLPSLDRLLLGPSSVSLPIETIALGATSTSFIMRGYPTGTFLARKFVRSSIEYRFPFANRYSGFDTKPAYLRRWHAAVFADAVTVDGAFYDFAIDGYRASQFGDLFTAVGAEARLDSTLFYHLPVQFVFGVHFGFDTRANPSGAYPVISIAL